MKEETEERALATGKGMKPNRNKWYVNKDKQFRDIEYTMGYRSGDGTVLVTVRLRKEAYHHGIR